MSFNLKEIARKALAAANATFAEDESDELRKLRNMFRAGQIGKKEYRSGLSALVAMGKANAGWVGSLLAEANDADDGGEAGSKASVNMQKHDAKYHPNGFDATKDTCTYREKLANGDDVDSLDPENVTGEEVPKSDGGSSAKTSVKTLVDNAAQFGEKMASEAKAIGQKSAASPSMNAWNAACQKMMGSLKASNPSVEKAVAAATALMEKRNRAASPSEDDIKRQMLAAFAKSLGIDIGSPAGGEGVQPAASVQGNGLSGSIEKVREMMKVKASPRLAGRLSEILAAAEAGKLNGFSLPPSVQEPPKPKRNTGKMSKNFKGSQLAPVLDSAADLKPAKTNILSKSEFKDFYDKQPEQMKILAISDLHDTDWKKKVNFKGRGTVLIAGDLGEAGATSESNKIGMKEALEKGRKWLDEEFVPHVKSHPEQKFVIMPGNRDHFLADPSMDDYAWPSNVSFLKDAEANVNGMRVYGMPWCEERKGQFAYQKKNEFAVRPFEISDAELQKHCDSVPDGLDVLMIHMPPKFNGYDGDISGGQHCGSEIVAKMIERVKPKLVITGHLHDGSHVPFRVNDDTVIVNVAYCGGHGHSGVGAAPRRIVKTDSQQGVGFVMSAADMKK